MHNALRRASFGAMAVAMAVGLAACGDDDDAAETGDAPEETTTSAAEEESTTTSEAESGDAEGETVEVTAVDYAFEGLPDTVAAGTRISLVNDSENGEVHEFVAIRIPDEETRPVSELVALPPEEIDALFGSTEPATVILAAPGETDVPGPVVGDGTLSEPGRYAVVCFIPVGADPAVVLDPNAEGPPESDAPPHAAQGMFAEVTVE